MIYQFKGGLPLKALVMEAYKSFHLRDVPTPSPAPGEVLVRVRACAVCGSDVHGIDGSTGRRQPPVIMGHEAAGEIALLGEGVTGCAPGDRVTFDSTVYCGACEACQDRWTMRHTARNGSPDGRSVTWAARAWTRSAR